MRRKWFTGWNWPLMRSPCSIIHHLFFLSFNSSSRSDHSRRANTTEIHLFSLLWLPSCRTWLVTAGARLLKVIKVHVKLIPANMFGVSVSHQIKGAGYLGVRGEKGGFREPCRVSTENAINGYKNGIRARDVGTCLKTCSALKQDVHAVLLSIGKAGKNNNIPFFLENFLYFIFLINISDAHFFFMLISHSL